MLIDNIAKKIPKCVNCIYFKLFPYMNITHINITHINICTRFTNYSNIKFTSDCREDEKLCGQQGKHFVKKNE
jgi:hypothetical protein